VGFWLFPVILLVTGMFSGLVAGKMPAI